MSTRIEITAGGVTVEAELRDTPCCGAIRDALPLETVARRWGQEVYCEIGVDCGLEDDARAKMTVGELGYWPTGKAFCVFFGPTPASGADGAPVAASEVNVLGEVIGDVTTFDNVKDGDPVSIRVKG